MKLASAGSDVRPVHLGTARTDFQATLHHPQLALAPIIDAALYRVSTVCDLLQDGFEIKAPVMRKRTLLSL